MRKPCAFLALALLGPLLPNAAGQSVISARSGLVNFFEGVVFLDGQPLARRPGTFARMGEGSTLLTESGRAEVLLQPDAYFRIGADSSMRMISGDIDDTRLELLSGSAILDSARAASGAFVTIVYRDATIRILKPGHYRVDAEPAQLRVFDGEAEVTRKGEAQNPAQNPAKIEASQLMPLDGASVVKRFTEGSDGLLDLWSEERGSLIASNLVNAQSIGDPLLDTGPDVPADLASYIGYVPMATIAPVGVYSYLYPDYAGFSPYSSPALLAFAPYRQPGLLRVPRYGYSQVYSSGQYGPGRIGMVPPPRPVYVSPPVFAPRPVTGPRGVVGIRPGGRR